MAHVRNWNGDLVEVQWVYCNACGCQYVEEVHEGKCPECGSHSYCTDEEVQEAERDLFGDVMEMNAEAFNDRMEWSG